MASEAERYTKGTRHDYRGGIKDQKNDIQQALPRRHHFNTNLTAQLAGAYAGARLDCGN